MEASGKQKTKQKQPNKNGWPERKAASPAGVCLYVCVSVYPWCTTRSTERALSPDHDIKDGDDGDDHDGDDGERRRPRPRR